MRFQYHALMLEMLTLEDADVLTASGFNGADQPVNPPFETNE